MKLSSDFLLCRGVGSLNPHSVQRATVFNNSLSEFKAQTMAVSPQINGLNSKRNFLSFLNHFLTISGSGFVTQSAVWTQGLLILFAFSLP